MRNPADTTATGDVNSATIVSLKSQLFQYLDSGDIFVGSFDQATEIEIAKTQLKLAQSYMTEGDRKTSDYSRNFSAQNYATCFTRSI